MEITIPSSVVFFTEDWKNKERIFKAYCFPHAVLRALEGERVKNKLTDEYDHVGCDDCLSFGLPQTHDLGSLRRSTP